VHYICVRVGLFMRLQELPEVESRYDDSVYLQSCDAALELGDVLQLPHPRPLGRLPIGQDPSSSIAGQAFQATHQAVWLLGEDECVHGLDRGSPLHPLGVPDQLRGGGGADCLPRRQRLRVRGLAPLVIAAIGGAPRGGAAAALVAVAVAAAAVLGARRGRRPAAGLVGEHGHELVIVEAVELAGRAVRGRHLDEGHRVAERPAVRAPPRRRELGEVVGPRHRGPVVAPLRPVVHRGRDPGRQLRHARARHVRGRRTIRPQNPGLAVWLAENAHAGRQRVTQLLC
jgi:hypothetical protein